jgi:hypothetical protein
MFNLCSKNVKKAGEREMNIIVRANRILATGYRTAI